MTKNKEFDKIIKELHKEPKYSNIPYKIFRHSIYSIFKHTLDVMKIDHMPQIELPNFGRFKANKKMLYKARLKIQHKNINEIDKEKFLTVINKSIQHNDS